MEFPLAGAPSQRYSLLLYRPRNFLSGVQPCLFALLLPWSEARIVADALVPAGILNSNRVFVLQPPNGFVAAAAPAPDGKWVVAGPFSGINEHSSVKLARFHQNGAVDTSFTSPLQAINGDDIRALAVQPDNRVLAGGLFTEFAGRPLKFLARVTAEGLIDPSFRFRPEPGDQIVSQIAPLPNGGMIIAGSQVQNGIGAGYYRRLAADGSADLAMKQSVTGFATSMLPLPDGKLLLGGANFRVAPNTDRFRVVRINPDGSWDATWNYGLTGSSGGSGVSLLALDADGKVLVGIPGFSSGPIPLERVLSDGTLDSSFHPAEVGSGWSVADVAFQPDGKMLVALNSFNSGGKLVRILADGSVDPEFNSTSIPGAGLRHIALLPDGTAMIFGSFTTWSGARLNGIARIVAHAAPAKVFSVSRSSEADELWEGSPQTFSVVAGGTPDPSYEWTQNGSPLREPNTLGESLVLDAVRPEQAGIYNVAVKNATGSDRATGFPLVVKSGPPEFVGELLQNQAARPGGTAAFVGDAGGGPLPLYQWFKDGAALPGQTGSTLTLSNLPPGIDKSVFTLQVQNNHGSITSAPLHIVLTEDGSTILGFALDRRITATFNPPPTSCALSPNAPWPSLYGASAIAVQDDGKILVGGPFGQNAWVGAHLQRLLPDGTQDRTFNLAGGADSSGLDGEVASIQVGADKRIWIGGRFTKVNGLSRNGLARLSGDGSVDVAFNPLLAFNGRPGGIVTAMLRQPDGKIVIGGLFEKINEAAHPYVARFNADGSVDETFKGLLRFDVNTSVAALALQSDGKLLVGGNFDLNATGRLIRLQGDGSVDQEFSPGGTFAGFGSVTGIALDRAGRILAVGPFASFAPDARSGIVRALSDGNIDPSFAPVRLQTTERFSVIAMQPNGGIVVGGSFSSLDQHPSHGVARLNADGSVDRSFLADTRIQTVGALALLNDGLFVAGSFSLPERLAGKIGDCPASAVDLGLVKLNMGDINQLLDEPPEIVLEPRGGTIAGGDFTLTVQAIGSEPLSYTWFREGRILGGSNSPSYTIVNARPADGGEYMVEVKNRFGTVASSPVNIQVIFSLSSRLTPRLDTNGFGFHLALGNNGRFEATDAQQIQLQVSDDLEAWQVVNAAIRVVNGEVELVDPAAVLQPKRFYRFVWGPRQLPEPTAVSDNSDLVPIAALPALVRHAAEERLKEFTTPSADGFSDTVGEKDWVGAEFAPNARYLFDPAHRDGAEPAYVEFKLIHPRTQTARGYMLVSMNDEDFPVLEFSTQGSTKTERVLSYASSGLVHKFFRMSPAFIAAEDGTGNLVTSWGQRPVRVDTNTIPAIGHQRSFLNGDIGLDLQPPASRPTSHSFATYQEMKNDFKSNPIRLQLRSLRASEALTHWVPLRGERYPVLRLKSGETNIFFPAEVYVSARVDSDDDANVSAEALRGGGVRMIGLHVGSDVVRLRTRTGALTAYTVSVSSPLQAASLHAASCDETVSASWWAGTGWNGDQRQYYQIPDVSCPVVGCGPTALAILLGWWDYNGVPSAFYKLDVNNGATSFRFNFSSLRNQDASKYIHSYEDNPANSLLMTAVFHDLHNLCNTFCVEGEGATYPDQMDSAFREYIRRVLNPQAAPKNEFGDQFVGCSVQCDWVAPGLGITDWETAGVYVANGIKAGHPGIIGIGGALWELHYPIAYVYRKILKYEGCGDDREVVDHWRSFKCNMGWGPTHPPEWHNAESVWFGLSADLYQKHLPSITIKRIPLPGTLGGVH